MSSDRELLARLNAGPRFLLLGQGLGRRSLAEAPEDSTSFFPEELTQDGATGMVSASGADFAAYEQSMQRIEPPSGFERVASIPWNTVLTTRIDGTLSKWLEADWRRVIPTASSDTRSSRSTTELQVRYLFGGLSLPDDERPPSNEIEWVDSQRYASDTLASLASNLITPRGVVLVEDWSPRDWLSARDLYNFASRLGTGQVHLFSVDAGTAADPMIAAAISRGALATHVEALAEFLGAATESGFLQDSASVDAAGSRFIPVGTGFVSVDVATWNRIVGTARPVDLELLEPFGHASDALTYQRFRTFLGSPEGAPPWRALATNMKLPRTFEVQLLKVVEAALDEPDEVAPVILQGQTATGKSLALAWLAQMLAKSGKAAVLHQARRRDRPIASEIEAYSVWAEGVAGLKTVLIWDGMVDADDYFALHRQLRARGQRVLIVGSTYLGAPPGTDRVITAPIHLDKKESEAYGPWLRSYGIDLPTPGAEADTSILAMLYRAIPETESGLRRGLALEMRAAESGMESLSHERKHQEPEARMTAVAAALLSAGLRLETLAPSDHAEEDLAGLAFAERSTTEQLSAMLLTAGRRGLNVPLELALRVVGRQGSVAIVDFIRHFDIFRWTEDANGNQFLGVRTRLEAELLARENLTDLTEIDVVSSFIHYVRPQFAGRTGGDEIQFIVDLMDQIGPQSNEQGRYGRWYGDLADAFASQREQSGVSHPRLVLLEVNLMREFVKRSQRNNEIARAERLARLRDSEDLLQRTLEETDISPRARLNLYVELAASLGSQLYELVAEDGASSADSIAPILERLVDAVMRARAADPENIYPVDVLAWAAKDAVSSGGMTLQARVGLLADAKASLDSIDPVDLSPGHRAKYNQRQADIARLLGDKELETSYLQELMAMDDPAAYYLLAMRALENSNDPERVKIALRVLLDAPASIRDDWRCARLILDLYWQDRTGERPLRGERNTVAFAESDWWSCQELLGTLHGAAEFDQYRIAFLRGLALFHVGSIAASQLEFRELGSLGLDVSRRVHLAYLASDEDGRPRTFTGRVAWASADGRKGRVWVDQLKSEVDFVPLRFSPDAYRSKGDPVPTFHIGFNYLGPIADPIRPRPRPATGRIA
ncbi:hypothetical protein [Glycomyces albidus]|uniref:Uncharacterized protein n=1 Tax=Glycomyces albidus TaxID=2656774 RepID=A0A6L5G4R3_9ACTN|nr:hypothetical protein [Glycomyces albidus]MQM24615.1 hypothetical protein [Glycomyces albidus]